MQHGSNRNKHRRNGDAPASRQLTLEDWVQMLEEDAASLEAESSAPHHPSEATGASCERGSARLSRGRAAHHA